MRNNDAVNTPVPIRRGDLLLAAGCGILQATALALGYGSLPRENYAALVCLGGVQGIALVLWRRHPVACQFLVWGAQLAVMVLMPRGTTFAGVAQAVAGFGIALRLPPLRGGLLVGVLGLAEVVVVAMRESPDPGGGRRASPSCSANSPPICSRCSAG